MHTTQQTHISRKSCLHNYAQILLRLDSSSTPVQTDNKLEAI